MTQIEKAKDTLKKLLAKNTEIAAVNTELNEQVKNYSETLQAKETEIISLKDQIKTLEEQVSSSKARLTEEKDRAAKAETEYKEKFDKYQLLDNQNHPLSTTVYLSLRNNTGEYSPLVAPSSLPTPTKSYSGNRCNTSSNWLRTTSCIPNTSGLTLATYLHKGSRRFSHRFFGPSALVMR